MDLNELTQAVAEKFSRAPSLGARLKFDMNDDGVIFVDGTENPPKVHNEDLDADTTFICSKDLFEKIFDGQQDPTMAYMMGKLKIQGSMGYAMKLASILGD